MEQGTVIALDSELAVNTACLGVEFKLPLANSIIYATAQKFDATVWTQDADFDGLKGVKYYQSKSHITSSCSGKVPATRATLPLKNAVGLTLESPERILYIQSSRSGEINCEQR